MKTTQDEAIGRRSFLRRTAGFTAGAAALVAAGLNTQTTVAAPAASPAAAIAPLDGAVIELLDMSNGQPLGYFTSCTNIGTENEIITYATKTGSAKTAGPLRALDVTMGKGVGNDSLIFAWRRLVEDGKFTSAVRDVKIIVYGSDGVELNRWRLIRTWPTEFIVRTDPQVVESLTIAYDKLVREL